MDRGNRLDDSNAATLRAFIFLLDPLIILRQRPDLLEILAALLAVKFISGHAFSSRSSPFGQYAIENFLNSKHAPCIQFGHPFHAGVHKPAVEYCAEVMPLVRSPSERG